MNIIYVTYTFFLSQKIQFSPLVTFIFMCDLIARRYGTLKLLINKTDVRKVFVGVDEDNS